MDGLDPLFVVINGVIQQDATRRYYVCLQGRFDIACCFCFDVPNMICVPLSMRYYMSACRLCISEKNTDRMI